MRRLVYEVVLLGITGAPVTVVAQSSVTLYGIIDVGVDWNTNAGGKKLISMVDNQASGNRVGFKGAEDLGNGWKAIFTIESGFAVTNGTQLFNGIFGRQAFVGLSHDDYGSLTFGGQYDSLVDTM